MGSAGGLDPEAEIMSELKAGDILTVPVQYEGHVLPTQFRIVEEPSEVDGCLVISMEPVESPVS